MPVSPSVPQWMRIPVCFSSDSLAGSSLPPEHILIKAYFLVSSPHRVLLLLWRGPGTKHRAVSGLVSHSQREQSPHLQNPSFEEWWVSVWVVLTPLVLQSNASVVPGLAYLNCGLGYCKSQMSSASQCRISPADLTTVPWGRKKTLKKKNGLIKRNCSEWVQQRIVLSHKFCWSLTAAATIPLSDNTDS